MAVTTETTDSQPQEPPQPQPRRRLERSRDERVLAGVCGGVASHLGVDPVLVRIVVVATMVFGGFGAVAYLAAWLMIPEQGEAKPLLGGSRPRQTAQVAIAIVVGIAVVAGFGAWVGNGFVFGGWPAFLLLVGVAVVWLLVERGRDGDTAVAPLDDGDPGEEGAAPPSRDRGSWAVSAIAAGAVCLVVGAVGALDASGTVVLGWGGVAAVAIVTTGVALVASSFFGGARALIPLGILLALLLGGTAAAGVTFNGGVGERDYRVLDGDDLRARYELGVGHLVLDLRDVELAQGTTHVEADLDVGMLEIVAPGGRFLDGSGVRPGDRGRGTGGFDLDRTVVVGGNGRRLEIDAHVGIGAIVVSERPGNDGDWDWSSRGVPPSSGPFAGVLR